MSEERPETCVLCGTPATWCTCTIEDTNLEITTLRSQVKALIKMCKNLNVELSGTQKSKDCDALLKSLETPKE